MKFVYLLPNYKFNFFKKSEKITSHNWYVFEKFFQKSRKKLAKVNFTQKNTSITILHKFFCVSMKSGNKLVLFKHFELFFRNYLNVMFYNSELENLEKNEFYLHYLYYDLVRDLIKKKFLFFNFNKILNLVLPEYNSLFSIKLKKLNKNLRLKYKKKYIYTTNYVQYKNRINTTLKFLNIQSFSIKSFYLSERYFKLFLMLMLSPHRTLPWKRRSIVYDKIIKQYKRTN